MRNRDQSTRAGWGELVFKAPPNPNPAMTLTLTYTPPFCEVTRPMWRYLSVLETTDSLLTATTSGPQALIPPEGLSRARRDHRDREGLGMLKQLRRPQGSKLLVGIGTGSWWRTRNPRAVGTLKTSREGRHRHRHRHRHQTGRAIKRIQISILLCVLVRCGLGGGWRPILARQHSTA